MKKRHSKAVYIISITLAIALVAFLGYSVRVYQMSDAEESGIVACDQTGMICTIALHIHSQIDTEICGNKVDFPLEEGDLSKEHTHKERDLIHWHDKLPYDKSTNTVLDWSPLKLGLFFEQMNMRFNSTCIGDYCNGDKCPSGTVGMLKMWVNGVEDTQFNDYVWKDQDKILIKFE